MLTSPQPHASSNRIVWVGDVSQAVGLVDYVLSAMLEHRDSYANLSPEEPVLVVFPQSGGGVVVTRAPLIASETGHVEARP